jgi:hypothetical protein
MQNREGEALQGALDKRIKKTKDLDEAVMKGDPFHNYEDPTESPQGPLTEKQLAEEDENFEKGLASGNPFYGTEGSEGYVEEATDDQIIKDDDSEQPPFKKAA